MSTTPTLLQDGYSDVPPGKIASVVTYLEMLAPPPSGDAKPAPGGSPCAGSAADAARYRAVYRRIGERWFWFSRLAMADAALEELLARPEVDAWEVLDGDAQAGLLELDRSVPGEVEIVYFGLVDAWTGRGAGRWLMGRALAMAWSRPLRRVWLHTCTLDHPGAVAFYRRSGFVPYKLAVEVADDPRLSGHLPPDSFPDVPLVRP